MSLVGTPPLQAWVCFRNKCRHKESALGAQARDAAPKVKHYAPPAVQELPESMQWRLRDEHGIEYETLFRHGVQWATAPYNRVAYPLWSPQMGLRGYVLRAYGELRGMPKSLTMFIDGNTSPVRCGWYRTHLGVPKGTVGRTVVLTEDAVSAMRLSQHGVTAVTLCGTQVSQDVVTEVTRHAAHIICALDNDAIATAIFYTRRYGLRCMPLARDIKDQPPHEFEHTLQRIERLAKRSAGQSGSV